MAADTNELQAIDTAWQIAIQEILRMVIRVNRRRAMTPPIFGKSTPCNADLPPITAPIHTEAPP